MPENLISSITLPNNETYSIKDAEAREFISNSPLVRMYRTLTGTAAVTADPYYCSRWDVTDETITEYTDGMVVCLKVPVAGNGTYGTGFQINNLGYKPVVYNVSSMISTRYGVNSVVWAVYNSTQTASLYLNSGSATTVTGCWQVNDYGTSDTNTIGYQLRTNSSVRPTVSRTRYYRILFSSADNTQWVPANTGYDNSATSKKTVKTTPINPFGRIVYMSGTTNVSAGSNVGAAVTWDQYALTLGYSFNTTGSALTLTYPAPVYIKCAPQADGSAIIDSTTPYVQALPSTADGKIYIYLGHAYSATQVELMYDHPIYYHDGTQIRQYSGDKTGASTLSELTDTTITTPSNGQVLTYDNTTSKWVNANVPTELPSITNNAGKVLTVNSGATGTEWTNLPTLGTAAALDVAASGNASSTQVVKGDDTRLTDSRPASDVSAWAKAATKPAYTASEVGAIPITQKGTASGVAELDSNGKVPSSQLPSYVDDVLEYANTAAFPATGESGKIYVALDTNKTYRWGGSEYVEISASLALGETSSTAYRGDRGKTAYDHSQITNGSNPHNTTLSGLTDTTITSPADKQILRYDSSTSKWINSDDVLIATFTESNGTWTCSMSIQDICAAVDDKKTVRTNDVAIYPVGFGTVDAIVLNGETSTDTKYVWFVVNAQRQANGFLGTSTYDSTNQTWTDSWQLVYDTGNIYFDDIVGVSLNSPTNGQVLTYNGSNWSNSDVPTELPSITGNSGKVLTVNSGATGTEWTTPTSSLAGLSDTTITTPSNGQVLTYDNTTSKWVNANVPTELPAATSSDAGKFVTVNSSGSYVLETVANAELIQY